MAIVYGWSYVHTKYSLKIQKLIDHKENLMKTIICDRICETFHLHTSNFSTLTLHNFGLQQDMNMKGKFYSINDYSRTYLLYTHSKLWVLKVDVCRWRVFANLVTQSSYILERKT